MNLITCEVIIGLKIDLILLFLLELHFLHSLYNFFLFYPLLIKYKYYLDISSVYFSSAFPFGRTFDIIVLLPIVITNFALYDMKLLAMRRGYEIKEKAALAYEAMNLIVIPEEVEEEGRGKEKEEDKKNKKQ